MSIDGISQASNEINGETCEAWPSSGISSFRQVFSADEIIILRHLIYSFFYDSRKRRLSTKKLLFSLETYPSREIKEGKTDRDFQSWIECAMNLAKDPIFNDFFESVTTKPVIKEYLDSQSFSDFEICEDYALIRMVDPTEVNIPLDFHQDAVFLRGIDDPHNFMNFWICLDPIDDTRPGIEFLKGDYLGEIFPQRKSKMHSIFTDMAQTGRYVFEPFKPKMNIGDVIVFSPYVIHRSSIEPQHFLPRASIDFRIRKNSSSRSQRKIRNTQIE